MTDQPSAADQTTPDPDDKKDHLVHPDSMNPHIVPEKASGEEQTSEDE